MLIQSACKHCCCACLAKAVRSHPCVYVGNHSHPVHLLLLCVLDKVCEQDSYCALAVCTLATTTPCCCDCLATIHTLCTSCCGCCACLAKSLRRTPTVHLLCCVHSGNHPTTHCCACAVIDFCVCVCGNHTPVLRLCAHWQPHPSAVPVCTLATTPHCCACTLATTPNTAHPGRCARAVSLLAGASGATQGARATLCRGCSQELLLLWRAVLCDQKTLLPRWCRAAHATTTQIWLRAEVRDGPQGTVFAEAKALFVNARKGTVDFEHMGAS